MNRRDRYIKLEIDWSSCSVCPIGNEAYNHVFGKGSIPCDVLFIGEAPGRSEDVLGLPFVGAAGQLLDKAIHKAMNKSDTVIKIFITNLLCCRPFNSAGGNRQPTIQEIENCAPRLYETIQIVSPKAIITLGKVPANYFTSINNPSKLLTRIRFFHLVHPAWVLRQGGELSQAFLKLTDGITEAFKYVSEI